MMERTLQLLTDGLEQLRLNTGFLLVAFLIIIFPAIFIWVTYSAFDTGYQNIHTTEKQTVSTVHDSLELLLESGASDSVLQRYLVGLVTTDNNITKAKILQAQNDSIVIQQSGEAAEIGEREPSTELFTTAGLAPGDSLIFDFMVNDVRTWQAFRQIEFDNQRYYLFTEHSFAVIDAVMSARQQQAYLYLSVVFLFVLLLAGWLIKQTEWKKSYVMTRTKLDEQMLFTNSVAHELRAPLTTIRGYISFLSESNNLTAEERKYTENINISAERLIALISDFLEVARIQSGNLTLSFKEIDVRQVIQAVKAEFLQVANERNLDLHLETPSNPVLAHTDPNRLQQVLTNLVSNALKYTEKGSVTVALKQTKLKTIITIKDTGHGISAEDQQKLFQAFTRVGQADRSGVTGTGLGMWITKQLVELLDGTVFVESIEGIGTHVKLTFDV